MLKLKFMIKRDDFEFDIANFPFLGGDVNVYNFACVRLSLWF